VVNRNVRGEIDPASINTPWDPQPIAWRHGFQRQRHERIQNLIGPRTTHIVREVLVHSHLQRNFQPLTRGLIDDTLAHTEDEFSRLRGFGLAVPKVEWHTFEDDQGKNRTLARVEVVEGETLKKVYRSDVPYLQAAERRHQVLFYESTDAYGSLQPTNERLCNVDDPAQYTVGVIRVNPDTSSAVHLHDIEPLYWLSRDIGAS
jgi:hypothetical protein